jgi:transposase
MARRRYPPALSDQEGEIVKEILATEEPYTTGRHAEVDLQEVWHTSFYIDKPGCQWQYLPPAFHRQRR